MGCLGYRKTTRSAEIVFVRVAIPNLPASFPGQLFLLGRRYVAASIAYFVSLEVSAIDAFCRFGFLARFRRGAGIAVVRMETVVDVALEFVSAMKPRAGANEAVAVEPLGTVVASGSATVRSDVIVPVGAIGRYSDFDADLSFRFGSGSGDADSSNGS
jgi:hypothetical protein